ncbi:site-specific integrase [Neobacillus terrae]|uniref:site-specific integrase n=1 Tax=Neobacillus terrae TaxID=3034837 RepID=UPI00140C9CAA|nr:site-specific integrase [Neobacillus terrae]NHM33000.1 site-specific integrase [Neobacillus terrae]
MRKGELLALKWNDIDFTKKVVYVKRTVSHIPSMGYVTTTPKTKNSVRQIPISDEVIRELLLHKSNQNKDKTKLNDAYQDQDLVISTELGKVQDPRNLLRTMKRLISISGVTSIRFHDIRHTHASILISSGIDVVKISARLGHANPKITLEIYAHLLPNIQNDVADIFQETLNKHQC